MKTVVAGALGECVHVAGVSNFLRLAESAGWRTIFLGPAVPVETFLEATRRENADLVGVSYRLTPETGERLLAEFAEAAADLHEQGVRFAFGGTPPVSQKAEALEGFLTRSLTAAKAARRSLPICGERTFRPLVNQPTPKHNRTHPLEAALSASTPPFWLANPICKH